MKYFLVEACNQRILGVKAFEDEMDAIEEFINVVKENGGCGPYDRIDGNLFYSKDDYFVQLVEE